MVSRISYKKRDIEKSGEQVASGKVKGQGRVVLKSGNGNLDQLHVVIVSIIYVIRGQQKARNYKKIETG